MITKDGTKMSKSRCNTVNPDDFDPDELRMYLMFLGHYYDGGDWSDQHIAGLHRFLKRMKTWLSSATDVGMDLDVEALEIMIDKNVERFKFNKVVSGLMEFYNKNKGKVISISCAKDIEKVLKVFAPGFKS
jgi:leucyl-tRNA synthetase